MWSRMSCSHIRFLRPRGQQLLDICDIRIDHKIDCILPSLWGDTTKKDTLMGITATEPLLYRGGSVLN